jgi:prophage regulatory protein
MSIVVSIGPGALEPEQSAAFCALSVSTMEKLEREGIFPRRRQLSDRRVGHLVSELQAWLDSRPVSDLAPPPNTGARKPRPRAPDPQTAHQGA